MVVVAQRVWQWKVAFYLFLAGVGAGTYVAGVLGEMTGYPEIMKIGVTLGGPLVLLAAPFLIADLGRPSRFWRVFSHPRTSWISRGSVILVLFGIVGITHIGLWLWPWNILADAQGIRKTIELVGVVLAVATAGYTGLLMGALIARPSWNSAALPVLFLSSALSTGVAGILLASWIAKRPVSGFALKVLGWYDILLIVIESVVIFVYLYETAQRARQSLNLLIIGTLAPFFWGGVILIGLAIPLAIELLVVNSGEWGGGWVSAVLSVCILAGGLLLRRIILLSGVREPLRVRRAFFVRPGL